MSTNIWLTDSDSPVEGYKVASLGRRGDACSLVRAVTNTETGPSSGIQVTASAGGTALAWITEPLDGTDLTAAAWVLHLWAKESNVLANAALRFQVFAYTQAEAGAALLDNNVGTELGTTATDMAITTAVASATTLADGNRLVFKVLIDDVLAGSMAAGYTATLSYNGLYPRAEGDSYIVCPDDLALTAELPQSTRDKVRRHLKDTSAGNALLEDAEIDQAFNAALGTYSKDRPREIVDFYDGDGSSYKFALPSRYIWGWSRILEIEYPADSTDDQNRTLLEDGDWEIRDSRLGPQPLRQIVLKAVTADAGTDNIAVKYTARHTHTDEMDTVPAEDFEAVLWLGASYAATMLEAKMAAVSNPTIGSDSTDYQSGEQRWRAVAKQFKGLYDGYMIGSADSIGAAGKIVDWDTNLSSGQDRMFHRRRWR